MLRVASEARDHKSEKMAWSLLKLFHTYETIRSIEGQAMLKTEQVIAQRLVNVIRTMRDIDTVVPAEDSEDFTAGYIQALDDLVAWLEEDFNL